MNRPLIVLALLPFFGCRNADVVALTQDNVALQADLTEALSRLEALEAEVAAQQSALDEQAVSLAEVQEDVDAQAGLDLSDLLSDVDGIDSRVTAIEETDLATETWVGEQNYADAADVTSLDAALDTLTDDVSTVSTAVGSLESTAQEHATQIAANTTTVATATGNISANATAIADAVTRVSAVELVADGLTADLATTAASLTDTTENLTALESDVDALATRMTDSETSFGDLETQVSGLTSDLVDSVADLADLTSRTDDLRADVNDGAGALSALADDVADLSSANAALELGASAQSALLAGLRQDLDVTTATANTTEGTVASQASLLSVLRSDLDDAAGVAATGQALAGEAQALAEEAQALAGEAQALAGEAQALAASNEEEGRAQAGLLSGLRSDLTDQEVALGATTDNLEVLTQEVSEQAGLLADAAAPRKVHRVVGQQNDGRDSGWLSGRTITFEKATEDTAIRLTWSDNRRGIGYIYGYWEAYIDGEPCVEPAAMRWHHHSISTSDYNDNHYNAAIVGYCTATASGPIGAGEHTVAIHLTHRGGRSSDWYVGWTNSTYVMEIEEVY